MTKEYLLAVIVCLNDAELAVKEKIMDLFVASQPTPPQLSYPNTRQGAMQCFDDMTARGMRLDLIEYKYYTPNPYAP